MAQRQSPHFDSPHTKAIAPSFPSPLFSWKNAIALTSTTLVSGERGDGATPL
ncbi:MAG: hypothetical protein VKJ64_17575 [Leptolyngbyaceae bacterium]|nr:hypothetical protein [Leptolyngbyaceae bacterium]